MTSGLIFWPFWVFLALLAAAVTFCAWYGPNQDMSNLSRWAWLLGWKRVPRWLRRQSNDRWAMIGGAGLEVVLVAAAAVWFWQHAQGPPAAPASPPASVPVPVEPAPPRPAVPARPRPPDRQLDDSAKNALLVNVPKSKQVQILVLSGDIERERFADQIETFLRAEGYRLRRRKQFLTAGESPRGTAIYADEKEPDVTDIRIGENDR